jgi:hypothetical protein
VIRVSRGRSSSLATVKKLLLSLLVVGLLGTVTYKRAYALMSAQATNDGSTVASGTIATGNTVSTRAGATLTPGTQCKSWTAATKNNINVGCDSVKWDLTTAGLQFPGQVGLGYIAIQNAGSLPATQLQLSMPTCLTASNTAAPAYVFASTGGAGDPCNGGMDMYVQEVSNFSTVPPPTTASTPCVYPENYYGTPAATCGWIDDTVAGLKSISCWDLGPMAANTTRYFVVGLRLSATNATNGMQGRNTTLVLRWHLTGGNNTYDTSGRPAGTTCANPNSTGIGQ